jgi:DNA invertase Pin-like site-specific DNA recombinase
MKKAYSYARFSSLGQGQGNSIERQLEIAVAYHARVLATLPLDTSRADEGFSAYKGHHVEKGSLGHFLAEIKANTIAKGSALIVENLDRISRQGPKIARKIIEQVVDNGVEIHIVNINSILTLGWENDPARSIIVDVELGRAYRESEYKSTRIGSSWRSNKQKTAEGRILTRVLPSWLTVVDNKIVTVDAEVELLREVFRLAALGLGSMKIAQALKINRSLSWINRNLTNRAVLGEFQPHRYVDGKRVPEGPIIAGYYPRIISHKEWDAAQATIAGKTLCKRYTGGSRNSDRAENLFSGILFDVTEEPHRSICYQMKSSSAHAFLISRWKIGMLNHRIRYSRFETAFLAFLNDLDWRSVASESEPAELVQAQKELEKAQEELSKNNRLIDSRNRALAEETDVNVIRTLSRQLTEYESRVSPLAERLNAAELKVESVRSRLATVSAPDKLLDLIRQNSPEANDIRLRLRAEIRKRINRIDLTFGATILGGGAGVEPGTGRIVAKTQFVNGAQRMLVFQGETAVALWLGIVTK